MHRFRAKLVVLLTATDPCVILPLMATSIPAVAVCHTPEHAKWFVAQAQDVAIKAMMDPQGKVYKAELAKLLRKDVEGEEPGPSNPDGKGALTSVVRAECII